MTPTTMDIKQTIEEKMADSLRQIVTLQNEKEQAEKNHEKELDDIFAEVLTVIDTFQKAELIIKERGLDQEESASKAIKRLLNAKKKALSVLEKFNVKKIEFDSGMVDDNLCETVETEPDASRKNDEIISVEKDGYTRNGHLIRRAEVVIVRN
ncbi:MAG: nucleotide exchange factor GrpE [Bacteroides sp.]|nr:nucleotide exchange factor GrpE [Bacteroides sp.]